MPRGFYALCLSLIFCALLTPARATASSPSAGFNASLKEAAALTTGKSTAARSNPLRTVVLDAGHGGKDPGGMGPNSREKHIALSIVRLLAIGIRTNFPDVEVLLTRSDDTFIPLHRRAAIANEAGADLFVSVHANIMPGSSATYGTETFVMGQHVADHNLAVAKRENAALLLEDNVQKNYGYDPNSDEGHIMMSTFQHAFLERSIQFADLVERQFAAAGRKSRGVKQAGFVVLKETTMPAVLVETGFMSNPDEEAYLLSGVGQQRLANALLKAFADYYALMADGPAVARRLTEATDATALAPTPPAPRRAAPPARTQTALFPDAELLRHTVAHDLAVGVRDREVSRPARPQTRRQWTAKGVGPQPLTYATGPNPAAGPAVLAREVAPRRGPLPVGRVTAPTPAPYAAPAGGAAGNPLGVLDSSGYRFRTVGKQERRPAGRRTLDVSTVADAQLTYAIQLIATKRELDLTTPYWKAIPYPIEKVREGSYNKYQVRGLANAAALRAAEARIKEAGHNETMAVVYYRGKHLAKQQVVWLLRNR